MFCTYCNAARAENEAPCQNCGAPSPLLARSQMGNWGTASAAWGGSNAQWDNAVPQLSFEDAVMPSWSQTGQNQEPLPQSQGPQSLLPVPYQGGLQQGGRAPTIPLHLVPQEAVEHLLPALPDQPETVYVPPMYTKPRPIIPRYRVISGLISVVIVSLLLCTGAGYYARTSGMLTTLRQAYGGLPPKNIKANPPAAIPDPPKAELGPASAIIPSATTALSVDKQSQIALQPEKIFKPNQTIYLAYSINPKGKGVVKVQWYTNKLPFIDSSRTIDKPSNASTSTAISVPTQGMVELYWNDQLAQRLFFAVR